MTKFEYGKGYTMWWKVNEVVFKLVRLDEDAIEVKEYATKKQCKDIYIEHDLANGDGLVDANKMINSDHVNNVTIRGRKIFLILNNMGRKSIVVLMLIQVLMMRSGV